MPSSLQIDISVLSEVVAILRARGMCPCVLEGQRDALMKELATSSFTNVDTSGDVGAYTRSLSENSSIAPTELSEGQQKILEWIGNFVEAYFGGCQALERLKSLEDFERFRKETKESHNNPLLNGPQAYFEPELGGGKVVIAANLPIVVIHAAFGIEFPDSNNAEWTLVINHFCKVQNDYELFEQCFGTHRHKWLAPCIKSDLPVVAKTHRWLRRSLTVSETMLKCNVGIRSQAAKQSALLAVADEYAVFAHASKSASYVMWPSSKAFCAYLREIILSIEQPRSTELLTTVLVAFGFNPVSTLKAIFFRESRLATRRSRTGRSEIVPQDAKSNANEPLHPNVTMTDSNVQEAVPE